MMKFFVFTGLLAFVFGGGFAVAETPEIVPYHDLRHVKVRVPKSFGATYNLRKNVFVGETMDSAKPFDCDLNDMDGHVLARYPNGSTEYSLVVFPQADWDKRCRKQPGVRGLPMAWVPNSAIETGWRNLQSRPELCRTYESYEEQPLKTSLPATEAQTLCEGPNCKNPLSDFGLQMVEFVTRYAADQLNREVNLDKTFDDLTKTAMEAAGRHRDPKAKQNACTRSLQKQMCELSPWKNMDLDARYQTLIDRAYHHTQQWKSKSLKSSYHGLVCVAAVETEILEPFLKNYLMCTTDENGRMQNHRHNYHGLGQQIQGSLDYFINYPAEKLGAFKSKSPEFSKDSYYACDGKLHRNMSKSPDLQIEIMAYHLARINDDYAAYNGRTDKDPNGQQHRHSYADAVQDCRKCLETCDIRDSSGRMLPPKDGKNGCPKDKQGAFKPAYCLSATLRSKTPEKHYFVRTPSDLIYTNFDEWKRKCEQFTK